MGNPISPKNKGATFLESGDDLNYEYPEGLDLHPDSELHTRLVAHILDAATESNNVMQDRFPAWKDLDEKLTVYIELDTKEEKVQTEDERKPVSIVLPVTYATREALLTYWVAAFLQHPIFRYVPSRDPNDTLGVLLLENLVEQDCIRSKVGLDLYTMWSDAFTYGFGVVSPTWREEWGYRTSYETEYEKISGYPYRKRGVTARKEEVQFAGNALLPIDPYNFLPDPNVPVTRVQDMDFCGWVERDSYYNLLKEEKTGGGAIFNVRYLATFGDKTSSYWSATSVNTGRYSKTGVQGQEVGGSPYTGVAQPADVIRMYMWIIPDEFGLGPSTYPEIWVFRLASDRVLIQAEPLGLDHNKLPVAVTSPDADGHTTLPVSVLEREYPIQHAIDWLWQSHVTNIRKAINNMFVIDPSLVNMDDFTDTRYGLVARMRASAWGRGVRDAVMQLPVQDVTQNHIKDIGFLMQLDAMVFASEQSKGTQQRSGERVSAQEARDTRTSFISKMEKGAKLSAMQAHYDIAFQFAHNTCQLLEDERYVRLTGEYERVLKDEYGASGEFLKVNPKEALDIRYDVVPHDGSIPGGEYADIWERLWATAVQHPETLERMDFFRMFKHIARMLGARNVEEFEKRTVRSRVETGENIERGQQAGNIVPIKEAAAAGVM